MFNIQSKVYNCKSALKFCQHYENQMRADALALSMMNKDINAF